MAIARSRRLRRTRATTLVAATVAAVLVVTMAEAPAFARPRRAPATQKTPSVPGVDGSVEAVPTPDAAAVGAARPTPHTAWPGGGATVLGVPSKGAGRGRAGGVDVAVRRAGGRAGAAKVKVEVLPQSALTRRGLVGVPLRVTRADGGTAPAPVTVEVGYASFANAVGGNWASRLRLTTLDGKPLPSRNVFARRTLVATVDAAPEDGTATRTSTFAVAAAASGGGGDYTATSLAPSSAWQVNTQTGDFSWSYPFRVPPAVNGPQPALQLGYSAGSVDGRTSSTNAQPSWIGEGHSLEAGYVERKYVACADDMANGALNTTKTGDLCWRTDNASVVLAGHAGELVKDATTGEWKLENDDGSKIEKLTGGFNGDNDTEYWKLTTTDGTQYFFGLGKRYSADTIATNATWTVPVFGNHTGEPCKTTTWATSYCTQAWRWNLAYVVDVHGNSMTYFYAPENNYYGRNNNTAVSQYQRGGYLTRIEYGERKGTEATTVASGQVDFTVKERCVTATTSTFNCESTAMTSANASNWPDVPFDQICTSSTSCPGDVSPTFFTRKRLTAITTKYVTATAATTVDTWALTQTFPDPGDGTSKALWLSSIQHTGNVGTAIALPKVTFTGVQMQNRVDGLEGAPPLVKYRVNSITSETGAVTSINYSTKECVASTNVPVSPETNDKRCFPVWWTPEGATSPQRHYFHKYVVTSVIDDDRTAGSGDKAATYEYLDKPAWHYDDNEFSQPKYRTYSDYRGYGKVRIKLGNAPDTQSVTENTYLRGMDGDILPGGAVRDIKVQDSELGLVDDHPRLSGQLRETRSFSGGVEVSGAIFDPWTLQTAVNGASKAFLVGTERSRRRVRLENGTQRRTETATTFDTYGMATAVDDLGDVDLTTDDLCTRTEYARNTALNIANTVARTETVSARCSATPARPADVVSDTRIYYDNLPTVGAMGTRGLATKTEILDSWPTGGAAVYKQKNRMVYDVNGRLLETYDAKNVRTALFAYTPATTGPVTEMKETNALGHLNTTTLHPAWAVPTAEVDANGKRTDMTYDALGRLTQVWVPGRAKASFATSPNMRFTYNVRNNGPVVVTAEELRNDGTYSVGHTLFDGLLRPRQTQQPAPGGGRIVNETLYDTRGLVVKQTGPYFNTLAPSTSLFVIEDASAPAQVRTTYDGANRATVSSFHVYGVEKWRTTTAYGGDRIHVDPPQGETATTTIIDGRERPIALREYHGSSPTGTYDETAYTYFPDGKPKTTVDAAGNTWSYEYDLRGRMTRSTDPDKGASTTTYDDLDRIATVTDARNETLALVYDALGRRTELRDDSVTGPLRAKWVFDQLLDALGNPIAKGKANASIRYVGTAEYKTEITAYDDLYRPTASRTTIPNTTLTPTGLAGTYNSTVSYNTDGSVKTLGQPAAPGLPTETLSFNYNTFGLPDTMVGYGSYVSATTYSPYGEVLQLTLGNHADRQIWHTSFFEEGTRRLQRSVLDREVHTVADSDVRYTYDPTGNVTRLSDVAGATPDTQCFAYDYLRRMTDAWTSTDDCAGAPATSILGTDAPYWHSYTFDVTGNRKTETQHSATGDTTRTYAYPPAGGPRPHALASVVTTPPVGSPTTEAFEYDATGNLESRTGPDETYTWDAEGRVTSVAGTMGTTSFLYDADGGRLLRQDPDGTTLYLDNTEIRLTPSGVSSTRYYDYAGKTVAVRKGVDVETVFSDHHGTATMSVDNGNGALTERRFTPFGGARGTAVGTWLGERSFVGGTADPSTRLVHMGAREYDPVHGRFISVDPVLDTTDPQRMNNYAYANNSPMSFSDPTGLAYLNEGGSNPGSSGSGSSSGSTNSPPATGAGRDLASEQIHSTEKPVTAKDHAQNAVDAARYRHEEAKERVKAVVKELVTVAADLLGITAAVDCLTTGDLGSCGEMAFNIVMSFAGGIAGKLLVKYGAPWKWAKGAKLVARIWRLADNAIDALRGMFKFKDELQDATRFADDLARQGDELVAQSDEVVDGAKCNSFVGSTPVLLADGSTKPISGIDVGDVVLAGDPRTGEREARVVTDLIANGGPHRMVDVSLSDGTTISATDQHPFWSVGRQRWVGAINLRDGARVQTADGDVLRVTGTRVYDMVVVAHNLTVDGLHTYYAGDASVLVHNCEVSRGSTGRTEPRDLGEQLAMEEAKRNPDAGAQIRRITMGDPRWPAEEGWVKMERNVEGRVIHYVKNLNTGQTDDFKFVAE